MHILRSQQFLDKSFLETLFDLTADMEIRSQQNALPQVLHGKMIAILFYEPSTRTRFSFEIGIKRLGGQVVTAENAGGSTSITKGESLEDTIKCITSYGIDAIIIRHPVGGIAERIAKISLVPIINAGDGSNEHPTQALLDLYTIKKAMGRLNNLHVAFGLDPLHSRTIRSFARLLSQYQGIKFTFVSPRNLGPAPEFVTELSRSGVECQEVDELKPAMEADVFYINRLQQERFADPIEFETNRNKLILTADMVKGKKVWIMNPLPRVDEIHPGVDVLPNALYFQQATNGLYVRMALLKMIFER